MSDPWATALVAVSVLGAGLMGYAIQRGATCMVAAMEEVASRGRFNRFIALIEASVLVSGGLSLAKVLGVLHVEPAAWELTGLTVAGGALLGVGAFVAGACVFGSIARLGSGDWAFLAVPPGFFAGSWLAGPVVAAAAPEHSAYVSPILMSAPMLLIPFGLFFLWRVGAVTQAGRRGMLAAHVWSPHVATSVIGLAFVVLLLSAGPWSYTEALSDAARGMASMTGLRALLFASLFGGALLGGWTAGRLKAVAPNAQSLARCFGGGALMGAGSLLIPGSNDGLLLVGMPLLHPQAWVALASMAAAILCALLLRQRRSMALSTEKA